MELFCREYGAGPPVIILHGLFGSSDNWMTQARLLSPHFRVYAVDQRNHGLSPHHDVFDYKVLTEDLGHFIETKKIEKPMVIGHSLGGKTAMNFAVLFPDKIQKLVVVDIMPKAYPVHHDHILEGLEAIQLDKITSRQQADDQLKEFVEESGVRQFLLKNLSRKTSGGFEWKINLPAISTSIEKIGQGLQYDGQFPGPALFVLGKHSNYYSKGDEKTISQYFPASTIQFMDTGHWVQAEKPNEFVNVVLDFLKGS